MQCKHLPLYLFGYLLTATTSLSAIAQTSAPLRPNIIHIFADDLGWGSVGFNNPDSKLETPNLDKLANEGMIFNRAYASTVCSPSRANLLTGFHNGHAFNDSNQRINVGLRPEDVTVAEILKKAGYATGLVGKWGWGGTAGSDSDLYGGHEGLQPGAAVINKASIPSRQGFDYFYGYLSHARAHSYFVDSLWTTEKPPKATRYQELRGQPLWLEKTGNVVGDRFKVWTHDLIAEKAEQYIAKQANQTEPFYLQVSYTVPHFDIQGHAKQPNGRRHFETRTDLNEQEKNLASMIYRMDESVGALIAKLEDPNGDGDTSDSIRDNTIIFFSSDNGPTPEDGFGAKNVIGLNTTAGLKGGKRDLWEGGIRVPTFVNWPNKVASGLRSDHLTDLADFLPTAAELAGVSAPAAVDGVSIVPELLGENAGFGSQKQRGHLVFEFHENWAGWASTTGDPRTPRWAVIKGNQKLIKFERTFKAKGNKPSRVETSYIYYDLAEDLSENTEHLVNPSFPIAKPLFDIAYAEGLEQKSGYAVSYLKWLGKDQNFIDKKNWQHSKLPDFMSNISVAAKQNFQYSTAELQQDLSVLGFEMSGSTSKLTVTNKATLRGENAIIIADKAELTLNNATLASQRWIELVRDGKLYGQGDINSTVRNAALFNPNSVAIEHNYEQVNSGQLVVDIRNRPNLKIKGQAKLGGELIINNKQIKAGNRFTILTANSVSGQFTKVTAPHTTLAAKIVYTDKRVTVQF